MLNQCLWLPQLRCHRASLKTRQSLYWQQVSSFHSPLLGCGMSSHLLCLKGYLVSWHGGCMPCHSQQVLLDLSIIHTAFRNGQHSGMQWALYIRSGVLSCKWWKIVNTPSASAFAVDAIMERRWPPPGATASTQDFQKFIQIVFPTNIVKRGTLAPVTSCMLVFELHHWQENTWRVL